MLPKIGEQTRHRVAFKLAQIAPVSTIRFERKVGERKSWPCE